jgi:uncharacterized membrane protein
MDFQVQVGGSGSDNYMEFAPYLNWLEWTNTSGSSWSAAKIRVEISTTNAGSTYISVGVITFATTTVDVNFKITFTSLRFGYGARQGISTLIDIGGYSAARDWQFLIQNTGGTTLGTTTRTNTIAFVDSGTAAMISSGNTDTTNSSGATWTTDRVQVNVKPVSSGTYLQVGVATFSSTSILVNQTLRLTNITFTFTA